MAKTNQQVREPVPFEDFKFSLDFPQDPFLQQSTVLDFPPSTHTILDEDDQKAFSSFLDAFFTDPDMMPPQPSFEHSHLFYHQHEEENPAALVTHILPQSASSFYEEQEQHRRNSILQSLDEQKRRYINHEPQTVYLRTSDTLRPPYTTHTPSSSSFEPKRPLVEDMAAQKLRTSKKQRTTKELLTEEEKKANHIASEQKRRSTIRHGFKELTELIPTLKNVSHSKSVVLFKAAEFIDDLEKCNRSLRHKLESLQLRLKTEGQSTSKSRLPPMMSQRRASSSSNSSSSGNSNDSLISQHHSLNDPFRGLPAETKKALLAHKSQQEQLMLFQEQLQQSSLFHANKLPPILGQYEHKSTDRTLLKEFQKEAIPPPPPCIL